MESKGKGTGSMRRSMGSDPIYPKINKKVENHNEREGHPPKDDHIHYGEDKKGRDNAMNRDGSMRHGQPPTNAVRKVLDKLFERK